MNQIRAIENPAPVATAASPNYGLRQGVLSPMETLAQSVPTMAPPTTPVATIPLVFALSGNGTWLAYVLATGAVLLVALCVARYARHSSSPESLYTYASMVLPPWMGATAAWSLLLAYIATGGSDCDSVRGWRAAFPSAVVGRRENDIQRWCASRAKPRLSPGLPVGAKTMGRLEQGDRGRMRIRMKPNAASTTPAVSAGP